MGYIVHHAIIVTSGWQKDLLKAYKKANKLFKWVSPVSPEMMNGYASFFIPPDGSKEGWQDSNDGDTNRQKFLNWLDKQRYEDGSTSLDYAEIQYGDEGGNDKILQSTNVVVEIVK